MRTNVSAARVCAYRVLRRVFEQGAYADRALVGEAEGLEPRDRALATQLTYGTVQRRATLDWLIERLAGRDVGRLEPAVLASLRLGLFQLTYLDGIAPHAAVNESVELAKRESHGAGLVNAVLRRAVREARAVVAELDDTTPERAALLHSVPVWLAQLWWRELGAGEARALLASTNRAAEATLRVNTLATDRGAVLERLPVGARPADDLPEGLLLEAPFDVHGSDLFADGLVMAQSRASMLVSRVLAPRAGERALDLCAAPGGKSTHLAALMEDRGELVSVERHPGRAVALRQTLARMRVTCGRVEEADAATFEDRGSFDRVLVDPPCSGLGTLRSRPDRRWRATVASIDELAGLQARILSAGVRALAPGGRLVYSVCTISAAEGERVVERVVAEHRDVEVENLQVSFPAFAHPRVANHLLTLPNRHGTDGFFIAALRARAPTVPA